MAMWTSVRVFGTSRYVGGHAAGPLVGCPEPTRLLAVPNRLPMWASWANTRTVYAL